MKKFLIIISALTLISCSSLFRSNNDTSVPIKPVPKPVETPAPADPITLTSPEANSVVSFPLTITGSAPGNWYFEAVFGIKLADSDGNILAETTATAIGNWMQAGPVPFSATIESANPTTSEGKLIFSNDNPSGLPEYALSFELPVKF